MHGCSAWDAFVLMVVPWFPPGVGGLSANAAARLFVEYPPAIRDQLLDLMFLPSGGAAWQLLKVEIGGDVESSCEACTV